MDRLCLAVALVLGRQQIAIGRIQINANQHRLAALEDLVMTASAYRAEVFHRIELTHLRHRLHEDSMDAAQRYWAVQHVTENPPRPAGNYGTPAPMPTF